MLAHSIFIVLALAIVPLQKASAIETNLPARESDLNGFCHFDSDRDQVCETEKDMAWRLRNRLAAIFAFREAARTALAGANLDPAARSRVEHKLKVLQDVEESYREGLTSAEQREARQQELIAKLNGDFNCRIVRFSDSEMQTYYRETSLPECNPLLEADHLAAARLLDEMAQVSTPVDAVAFRAKSKAYMELGPNVRELGDLRRRLLEMGVIQEVRGELRVNHIGHPFQKLNHTDWLEGYVHSARKLNRKLSDTLKTVVDICPQPACDPRVFRLAEAVTLRPPVDWVYLRDGDRTVAPSPYALNYFSQRYSANGRVLRSIGLDPEQEWLWRSQVLSSRLLDSENVLLFSGAIGSEQIAVSVEGWGARTEYPFVMPLFFLLQEARNIAQLLEHMKGNVVAESIREIRFAKASEAKEWISLVRIPGGFRLVLKVLEPTREVPVEVVRQNLQDQIPKFLETAEHAGN